MLFVCVLNVVVEINTTSLIIFHTLTPLWSFFYNVITLKNIVLRSCVQFPTAGLYWFTLVVIILFIYWQMWHWIDRVIGVSRCDKIALLFFSEKKKKKSPWNHARERQLYVRVLKWFTSFKNMNVQIQYRCFVILINKPDTFSHNHTDIKCYQF